MILPNSSNAGNSVLSINNDSIERLTCNDVLAYSPNLLDSHFIPKDIGRCSLYENDTEDEAYDSVFDSYVSKKRNSEVNNTPALNLKSGKWDNEFIVDIKLSGYIKEVDSENQVFIVALTDKDDPYEKEFLLRFSDVSNQEDLDKMHVGTRIIYVYGKESINGTYRNASEVIIREEGIWNRYLIKKLEKETESLYSMINEK